MTIHKKLMVLISDTMTQVQPVKHFTLIKLKSSYHSSSQIWKEPIAKNYLRMSDPYFSGY